MLQENLANPGGALAAYDLIAALVIFGLSQASTKHAGLGGEYNVRSLIRRVVYFIVCLALLYRVYVLQENPYGVTIPGMVTGMTLTGAIILLGFLDYLWERDKRRDARHNERHRHQ
jgi:hypothetical protein